MERKDATEERRVLLKDRCYGLLNFKRNVPFIRDLSLIQDASFVRLVLFFLV